MVTRGVARSRGHASELIKAGLVHVNGEKALRAALAVTAADIITAPSEATWAVGRGAAKLQAALDAWGPHGLHAQQKRCADVGACTGGFTQVLLRAGAREVLAIDVGHDQLHPLVRDDARVRDLSGTTIRGLTAQQIDGPVDLLVADLSFISLTLVMPDLAGLLGPIADAVVLVKPQFEVGRHRLGKNGIVKRGADHGTALLQVVNAAEAAGLAVQQMRESPVTGSRGNTEYLAWFARGTSAKMERKTIEALIRDLIEGGPT